MALSHYATYAAGVTGTQPSINLDPSICPFQVTAAVFILSGSASFGLQWSFDDQTVSDANSNWFNDTLIPTGTTASSFENINTPVTKIRIVIASNTGGLKLTTLQGFTTN
jgi:hypothetical protein